MEARLSANADSDDPSTLWNTPVTTSRAVGRNPAVLLGWTFGHLSWSQNKVVIISVRLHIPRNMPSLGRVIAEIPEMVAERPGIGRFQVLPTWWGGG